MSTERDSTRILRSWLELGATDLPDRVLDRVLDQLPATPQRRRWWPVRRFPNVNSAFWMGAAATTVILVGVIGTALLPGGIRPGGGAPTSANPSSGARADSQAVPVGSLTAGRYHVDVKLLRDSSTGEGERRAGGVARVSFDLPAGWTGFGDSLEGPGWAILKGEASSPGGMAMAPWAVDRFYLDPCHTIGAEARDESVAVSYTDGFDQAGIDNMNSDRGLGRLWGGWADDTSLPPHAGIAPTSPTATKPVIIQLAGLDGWYMAVRTPTDLDIAACDTGRYILWGDTGGGQRYVQGPGQLDRLWVVDVDGSDAQSRTEPLVIDAASQAGASPADLAELQAIIDSIEIELLPGS